MARKVVGVGSVGTRCWIAYMQGRDESDPLFLQIKEAEASVLEPYAGKSVHANHGRRVVEGQRLTQSSSDIFLGWDRATDQTGTSRDFYVRQLWDGKMSPQIDVMEPEVLKVFGRMCGSTLARAHARSGDRIAIASYLGNGAAFDRAVATFARAYADQNDRDYETVVAAIEAGELEADMDTDGRGLTPAAARLGDRYPTSPRMPSPEEPEPAAEHDPADHRVAVRCRRSPGCAGVARRRVPGDRSARTSRTTTPDTVASANRTMTVSSSALLPPACVISATPASITGHVCTAPPITNAPGDRSST